MEPGSDTYLEVDGVTVEFTTKRGGLEVLGNVSATVPEGEFCCIVGPSGCGKSTLLRIMDGLLPATSGAVRIRGREVTAPSLDVGFVFQQFNLLPWRTVMRNVIFGLESKGVPKAERRDVAQHWINIVGLEGFEDHFPGQLSGGMQQRVSLARALAIEPELLLMDEPFGSLDAQTRMIMQEELLRIWERDKRTIVFVTHDIDEAIFMADRILVMGRRPGRFIHEVKINFDRPRDLGLRGTPEFAELKEELWERLRTAIKETTAAHTAAA
jgi:ABC-type nitrate/sulfonate/bicarbonate transport system ATPase subunit